MRLVLASGSPRRAELLRAAGYDFNVVVTDVDESIRTGEPPEIYVRRLAAEKSAAAVRAGRVGPEGPPYGYDELPPVPEQPIILGADTVVVVDGEILGKPRDDAHGEAMLRLLSGKRHMVVTGVSLRQGAYELGRVEQTSVYFRALSAVEIELITAAADQLILESKWFPKTSEWLAAARKIETDRLAAMRKLLRDSPTLVT